MCFELDSSPPVPHIDSDAVRQDHLTLTAGDGNEFAAFEATAGSDSAVVVLPDVRGLFRFYEELALRFAEHGTDVLAIDYFGRTAGIGVRDDEFDYWPEVKATKGAPKTIFWMRPACWYTARPQTNLPRA